MNTWFSRSDRSRQFPRALVRLRDAVVLFALAGPLASTPARLHAQGTGTLAGTVTEQGGTEVIQGASISAVGTQRGALSRADGTYRFVLPAGQ